VFLSNPCITFPNIIPDNREYTVIIIIIIIIPVIIGATGTISKSFRKYVSSIPGKHEVKKLQKTAPYWALHTHCEKY